MIGMLGGTFDPVHNGHVHAAKRVMAVLACTQMRLVLAARPGHRRPPQASLEHRWQMLKLAVQDQPGLVADNREMDRPGFSYTVNTLEDFHQHQPDQIVAWVVGQDAFATLTTWHRWQDLLSLCNLVVVARPGETQPEPKPIRQLWQKYGVARLKADRHGQIVRLEQPMQEVSATQIRRKIAQQAPYEHLLAHPVSTYIKAHDLYVKQETVI